MNGFTNAFETDLLNHIFGNANIANLGDATGLRGSTTAGSLYVALHSAFPAEAGDQTSNETAYTSYARQAVSRTSGWTVTNNQVVNAAQINFPQCGASGDTLSFWSVGVASAGASETIARGHLGTAPKLAISNNTAGDIITSPSHGLSVNDRVVFYDISELGTQGLPGGITEGTVYFVKTVSGDDITISTTQGGATLDITSAGVAALAKVVPLAVSNGITPQISAGALVFKLG
jgi:hypothetical protein